MERRRKGRRSKGKRNIIAGLIQEYNIKTAADIEDALKDLHGVTIQEMITAAYPNTEYQPCIIHQVRNTLKYVVEKNRLD